MTFAPSAAASMTRLTLRVCQGEGRAASEASRAIAMLRTVGCEQVKEEQVRFVLLQDVDSGLRPDLIAERDRQIRRNPGFRSRVTIPASIISRGMLSVTRGRSAKDQLMVLA